MQENTRSRVYMLDILRGIAVIGMVLHHALVSFEISFMTGIDFLYTESFRVIQFVFVIVFLLVSGICTNYSRNIMKRGIIVCIAAVLVSFTTCIVLPAFGLDGLQIYFGILHMFGLSMLIFGVFRKKFEKISPLVGIISFTVLFVLYYAFYRTNPTSNSWILMLFGFEKNDLYYGDWYPLFPFFFMFAVGTYIGKYIKSGKFPKWFYTVRCKPLEICGKYSLWVYLMHQPIIFGILELIYNLTH